MVLRWRRVFCTSIPPEPDSTATDDLQNNHIRSHSVSSPTLRCRTTVTAPQSPAVALSPELRYETKSTPRSPFSFLKSGLRLRTRRCGLCLRSVKKGRGMATFTAECSHNFHYPCISDHVRTQGSLACPVCSSLWKEMPLLCVEDVSRQHVHQRFDVKQTREKLADKNESRSQLLIQRDLKVYNDDEPLVSLTPKARFNPIPEYDENCDEDSVGEFEGFCVNGSNNTPVNVHNRDVGVRLLQEAAMIAASRRHETYAVVLKVKAPSAPVKTQQRAPIDLVTVVDVSSKITTKKLHMTKKAMRSIISSLSSSDRLSIVAFSSHSKRLQPLRRMTTGGKRAARCIIDAMAVLEGSSNSKDAVKKAVKVLLDRQEKNPVATVILLTDHFNHKSSISSIGYPHSRIDIRIHSLKITEDHLLAKRIGNLLNVVVQDLRLQLELVSGSTPAVIAAVYSPAPEPTVVGSSSVEIGELSADEERELLVELKTPSSVVRSDRVLSVRCCYRESSSQEMIYGTQQPLMVPHPTTVGSSASSIERLRMLFMSTRALAQSRRLREGNDLIGAYNILVSARGLMEPSGSARENEFMLGLEAELSELHRRLKVQAQYEGQGEPLTPTSAWRMADKLAKVAMMRKSVNRVGDLHGFEEARF